MGYMFSGCVNLRSITFNSTSTQKVENMEYMFYGCSSLTEFNITEFDTKNVQYMNSMFSHSGLKSFDFSLYDFSNAKRRHLCFRDVIH